MAELEHPRTTGPTGMCGVGGMQSSGGMQSNTLSSGLSLGQSSIPPTSLSILTGQSSYGGGNPGMGCSSYSGLTSGVNSMNVNHSTYNTMGVNSMNMNPIGVTSSASSHALADGIYSGASAVSIGGNVYSTGANVSPLPVRANTISTIPPLCQVLTLITYNYNYMI